MALTGRMMKVALGATVLGAAAWTQVQANVWGGVYTDAQAQRGQALFSERCASCHGDNLAGMDVAPPLAGPGFLGNWEGQSAATLANRIQTTMPLDQPGSLPMASVADITAYIFSKNGFPAGQAELPRQAGALGGVIIAQNRPAG